MTTKNFIKKVFSFFLPFRKYFLITIVVLIIIQAVAAFSPYLFGRGVDAVIKGDIKLTFIFLGVSFLSTLFSSQILWFLKEYIDVKYLDVNINQALSVGSLKKMFGFSIGQHINEHSGVKQTIVNKGQGSLTQLVDNVLYNILQTTVQIIVTLVILAFFDWRVAATALAFVHTYL